MDGKYPQHDSPISPQARQQTAALADAAAAAANPQRLSPFATMADKPMDTSSPQRSLSQSHAQTPPADQGGRRAGDAIAGLTPPADYRSPSPGLLPQSPAAPAASSRGRPPLSPNAAAAYGSRSPFTGAYNSNHHSSAAGAAAAQATAIMAAINANSSSQQMGGPRPRQRLSPQQLIELQMQEQIQRLQQGSHAQQQLQLQQQQQQQQQEEEAPEPQPAPPATFQDAIVDCLLRVVTTEEVNDLKNDIAVLTQFDIQQVNKSRRGPQGNSSSFKGVTKHRRTQRWEAHIWDAKKQVYLGGFDSEVDAAKAHDIMAIKTRGIRTLVNFKICVYDAVLPFLEKGDLTRENVIQGLRASSKALPRHQARLSNRAAANIQASPQRTQSPVGHDDPHLAAAMLLQQVAAGNASPRTPVSARHPAGGLGAGMWGVEAGLDRGADEEIARALQLLARASNRRKSRSALAAEVAAAAAAAADSDGDQMEAELEDLLAGGSSRAGKGRKSSNQASRGAPHPPVWHPASGPMPQGSLTLPGINHFSPQGMLFGRTLQPGLYPLDPQIPGLGAYSALVAGFESLGFRSGFLPSPPQGFRGDPHLGGSFGQGLAELQEGFTGHAAAAAARGDQQLPITSLDVAEGLGFHAAELGGGGIKLQAGGSRDGVVPRRPSQYTGLSTQQLLDAANAQIGEVGLGMARPTQQGPMGSSPAGLQPRSIPTSDDIRITAQLALGHFNAAAAAAAAEAAIIGGRTQSSELEQQLALLPPTIDAAGRGGGGSNSQFYRQLGGVPTSAAAGGPRGSRADAVAAAAAAMQNSLQEAAAAATAAAASRGLQPNLNTLLAAAARHLPNVSAGPGGPGGPGGQGATQFDMYSLPAGQPGPQGSSMMAALAAAEGGLRNPQPDVGVMSTPDDAMLIPNMHVGAHGLAATGGLEAEGHHGMQLQQGGLEVSAFPALDFLHQSQQQQQQQGGHGVSAAAAAEAEAAMAANRASGREFGYSEAGDELQHQHQQQQQQQLTLGAMMSGVKRGADGQHTSAGAGTAAAAAAAAAGRHMVTLPGFPVDDDEVAGLETTHAAAAAAAGKFCSLLYTARDLPGMLPWPTERLQQQLAVLQLPAATL